MSKNIRKKSLSPIGERTTDSTRDAILSAALHLFAEKGFDGVSTKEICEQAQANISSLHYHFETKEKLFECIVETCGKPFFETTTRALSPPQSVEEMRVCLELYLEEIISMSTRHPQMHRILSAEMSFRTKRCDQLFEFFLPVLEKIAHFFKVAQKNKLIRHDLNIGMVTILFTKLIHPELDAYNRVHNHFKINLQETKHRQMIIKTTIDIFMQGLLART